jgi:NADPH-dependent curcumin reductase CurA
MTNEKDTPQNVTPIMNRADRRELERDKKKLQKKRNQVVGKMVKNHQDKEADLQSPATLQEVIQVASSVSADAINHYHHQSNPLMVSVSLHAELLKNILIEKGLITEEEYDKRFEESVADFNRMREEKLSERQTEAVATSSDVPLTSDVDSPGVGDSEDNSTAE